MKSFINILLQRIALTTFLHMRYILANSPLHMVEGGQPSHPEKAIVSEVKHMQHAVVVVV